MLEIESSRARPNRTPLAVLGQPASDASSASVFNTRGLGRVFVPFAAVSPCSLRRRSLSDRLGGLHRSWSPATARPVDCAGDRFEVSGVAAQSDLAQVVDFHPIGNRSVGRCVGRAMRLDANLFSVHAPREDHESSVVASASCDLAGPDPAPRISDRHLGPEALRQRRISVFHAVTVHLQTRGG